MISMYKRSFQISMGIPIRILGYKNWFKVKVEKEKIFLRPNSISENITQKLFITISFENICQILFMTISYQYICKNSFP